MSGYKTSILILGIAVCSVFIFVAILNTIGTSPFSRAMDTAEDTMPVSGETMPRNVLLAPLSSDSDVESGTEAAAIISGDIHILDIDGKGEVSTIAIIEATEPQEITWVKNTLYWVEKRAVSSVGDSKSQDSFVLVEGSFENEGASQGSHIQKKDVYRSREPMRMLHSDSSGQLMSFIEGVSVAESSMFIYSIKTGEVQRIVQSPLGFAWSPDRSSIVISSAQEPLPKTVFFELSIQGEVKTQIDLPAEFGGYGLSFLNNSSIVGLRWDFHKSAILQKVDLRSNALTVIGEVKNNSDARFSKQKATSYPKMHTAPDEQSLIITISDQVNSVYTLGTVGQIFLPIDEEVIGFIDSATVLSKRGTELFSVGLQSGIQTVLASDVIKVAVRK